MNTLKRKQYKKTNPFPRKDIRIDTETNQLKVTNFAPGYEDRNPKEKEFTGWDLVFSVKAKTAAIITEKLDEIPPEELVSIIYKVRTSGTLALDIE